MEIVQSLDQWYASADGGTDGGEVVRPTGAGPFTERPILKDHSEQLAMGPCGERLLTVTHVYRAGERHFIGREQFWLAPDGRKRVKLLDVLTRDDGTLRGTLDSSNGA